jgi:hypothetical protein
MKEKQGITYPYPLFDFDFTQIRKFAETLARDLNAERAIAYLEYVKEEQKIQTGTYFPQLETQCDTLINRLSRKKSKVANASPQADGKPPELIDWQEDLTQLVYLFQQLYEAKFLSPSKRDKLAEFISKHFTLKGEEISKASLHSTNNNIPNNKTGKPKESKAKPIDEIVSRLKAKRE